jgi:hypothetical protein
MISVAVVAVDRMKGGLFLEAGRRANQPAAGRQAMARLTRLTSGREMALRYSAIFGMLVSSSWFERHDDEDFFNWSIVRCLE